MTEGKTRYSIKMRASKGDFHISGAEKIVQAEEIEAYCARLLQRAMKHGKGKPDMINLKVEEIDEGDITFLQALPVTTIRTSDPAEGIETVRRFLEKLELPHTREILSIWQQSYGMRGAILLDADTLERLEPDRQRGVRATYMDRDTGDGCIQEDCGGKNHFNEALVLATKVVSHPNIVAELCISDDPDYVTGYIASKELGYVRITTLKELGSPNGGRVFLFRGNHREELEDCIDYLQRRKVLVQWPVDTYLSEKERAEAMGGEDKWAFMEEDLKKRRQADLFRTMKIIDSPQSAHVTHDGKQLLMLASNAYLDLCSEPRIKEAAAKALEEYGTGAGGSRLTTGTTRLHAELEELLARFKGRQAALVFNTGFAANSGILPAVCGKGSVIFSDELNHASIIDGCRMAGAETVIYRHNDMGDLERKIREKGCPRGLAVSDAVFSMDGDIVDLPGFIQVTEKYNLLSMIDEAHATGVIGQRGKGTEEYYHMEGRVDILMGTLSKALGAEGGYVCGSDTLISYLRNKVRSFIFSTSLSPVTMAAAARAVQLLEEEPQRVKQLQENVSWFCQCLNKEGIAAESQSAIVPIRIGEEAKALRISEKLLAKGYFLSAIRYPTVKKGEAMLRAALMATHSKQELQGAAEAIAAAIREEEAAERLGEKQKTE